MLKKLLTFYNINEKIKITFFRFPLVCLFIFIALFFVFSKNHDLNIFSDKTILNIVYTSLLSIVALTALTLFKEAKKLNILLYLFISFCIVSFIFYNVFYFKINTIFILLASISSLIFAPFLFNKSSNKDLLLFTWDGLISISFAAIASLLLALGFSAILASINYLFGFDINHVIFEDILTLVFVGLFPLLVLGGISQRFDYSSSFIQPTKAISILIKNILLPLIFIYMTILYLYFIKILIQAELPKGNLASMIIAFGSIGIFIKIVVFILKENKSRVLSFFDKYYFHFMIIPIIMLGVSFYRRVSEYGITESRYSIAVFILWFSFISFLAILKKENFNFKYIFISLSLFLFISILGPLSATSISAKSQMERFKMKLNEHKLLVDNQIIKVKDKLSFDDELEFTSFISYLISNDITQKELNQMLEDLSQKKEVSKFRTSSQVLHAMGINYTTRYMNRSVKEENPVKFDLSTSLVSIEDYTQLMYYRIYSGLSGSKYFYRNKDSVKKFIQISIFNNNLIINFSDGSEATFDIDKYIQSLKDKKIIEINEKNKNEALLEVLSSDKKYSVKLRVNHLYYYMKKLNSLEGYILFKENK